MLDYPKIVVAFLRARGYEDAADDLEVASTSVGSLARRIWTVASVLREEMAPEGDTFQAETDKGTVIQVNTKGDAVELPAHYAHWNIEPIRFFVENDGATFLKQSVMKYLCRYLDKNGHEDLAKANRYLTMLRMYEAGYSDWWEAYKGQPLPTDKGAALKSTQA